LSAAFASIAAPITIAPEEWRILALLDGRRTVTEVASLAGIDASEARRSLFHLLGTGVIEAAPTLPVAPPLPSPRVVAPIEGPRVPPPAPPSRSRPIAVDDAGDGAERPRPPAPAPAAEPAEDFALFQQAAIASAREVPASAPPGTQRVSDFDAPGPEDMTTRVPDPPAEKAAVSPPPPPPGPPRRARKSKEKSAAGTPLRADDDVDPALIARLIQGVKEL
jgi:hypothetical protein